MSPSDSDHPVLRWSDRMYLRALRAELGDSLDELETLLRRRAAEEDVTDELVRVSRHQQELNAQVQEYVSADPATTRAARDALRGEGLDR